MQALRLNHGFVLRICPNKFGFTFYATKGSQKLKLASSGTSYILDKRNIQSTILNWIDLTIDATQSWHCTPDEVEEALRLIVAQYNKRLDEFFDYKRIEEMKEHKMASAVDDAVRSIQCGTSS